MPPGEQFRVTLNENSLKKVLPSTRQLSFPFLFIRVKDSCQKNATVHKLQFKYNSTINTHFCIGLALGKSI